MGGWLVFRQKSLETVVQSLLFVEYSVLELVDAAVPSQALEPFKHTILGVEGVKVSYISYSTLDFPFLWIPFVLAVIPPVDSHIHIFNKLVTWVSRLKGLSE